MITLPKLLRLARARLTGGRLTGEWHPDDLARMFHLVREVPGGFAEVGVHRGRAFRHVVAESLRRGARAHAFDSFEGMAEPTEHDHGEYVRGQFDVGGVQGFRARMQAWGCDGETFDTWPGFIPHCFEGFPGDERFRFAILDVDHYEPTVIAMRWIWERTSVGGILAFDDFHPARPDRLATRAINEFLRDRSDFEVVFCDNHQLAVRRTG